MRSIPSLTPQGVLPSLFRLENVPLIIVIVSSILSACCAQGTTQPNTGLQSSEKSLDNAPMVNFPLGHSYANQEYRLGDILGSIIGVDVTATTYELACNSNAATVSTISQGEACVSGTPSLTITQGPGTVLFSQVFTSADYTQIYSQNCTIASTFPIPTSTIALSALSTILLPSIITCFAQVIQMASYDVNSQGETFLSPMTASEATSWTYGVDVRGQTKTVPWIPVQITAGAEKIAAFQARKTSGTTESVLRTASTGGVSPSATSEVGGGKSGVARLEFAEMGWTSLVVGMFMYLLR